MAEVENRRKRRTPEEMAADLDAQIEKLEQSISELEAKKQAAADEFDKKIDAVRIRITALQEKKKELLAPKHRKPRITKKQKLAAILKQAQKNGMKPEEIAAALGVELEE